jgi:hypothetical protein
MEHEDPIANRDQVEEDLRRLGFPNADSILNTASVNALYSNEYGPALECTDFNSDPDRIEYSFYLVRDKSDAGWHVQTITALVEMPSTIHAEVGFVIVGSNYDLGDGPLPMRHQIKAEVGHKVKIQKEKERAALGKAHKIHIAIQNPPENTKKGYNRSNTQNQ